MPHLVSIEQRDTVTVVTLENGAQNLLTLQSLGELGDTLEGLREAGPLVLTGAGRMFSAGIDLPEMLAGGPERAVEVIDALERVVLGVFDHPGPVVAALNGHALAGGCLIALAADSRLMAGGTIGLTEVLVGVPYPTVAIEVVRHALGPSAATVVMSGARYPVEAAEQLGLVKGVADGADVLEASVLEARMLAAIDPQVYTFTKRQLQRPAREQIDHYSEADGAAVRAAWQSPPTIARIRTFLDSLSR